MVEVDVIDDVIEQVSEEKEKFNQKKTDWVKWKKIGMESSKSQIRGY